MRIRRGPLVVVAFAMVVVALFLPGCRGGADSDGESGGRTQSLVVPSPATVAAAEERAEALCLRAADLPSTLVLADEAGRMHHLEHAFSVMREGATRKLTKHAEDTPHVVAGYERVIVSETQGFLEGPAGLAALGCTVAVFDQQERALAFYEDGQRELDRQERQRDPTARIAELEDVSTVLKAHARMYVSGPESARIQVLYQFVVGDVYGSVTVMAHGLVPVESLEDPESDQMTGAALGLARLLVERLGEI